MIWFPYRALQDVGLSGTLSTVATYFIALCFGLVFFRKTVTSALTHWKILLWIALTAGWTNLAFVLAVISGTVVRVTLLFYLAPLWTVIFSRVLLKEMLSIIGMFVIALSLAGALTMLWRPGDELPLPRSVAEWLGLSAGLTFALSNVLTRKAEHLSVPHKSLAVWIGVAVVALAISLVNVEKYKFFSNLPISAWVLMVFLSVLILVTSFIVQYGVSNTPSNQAIVIFLFELVVVAISSHLLAEENVTWQEWIGAAMIISATLFSTKMQASVDNHAKPREET